MFLHSHFNIHLADRTEITTAPASRDVLVGEDVTLHCEATTDAQEMTKLDIKWKKNGELIDFEEEQSLSFNEADNSLTIAGKILKFGINLLHRVVLFDIMLL